MSEKPAIKPPTAGAVDTDSRALHYATRAVVILVAIGAAILSFDALAALATASGIREEFSWIWAIVIDGFIMVATFAAFALKNRGRSKYYAWTTLGLFVILSIIGNAWHAVIAREGFVLPLEAAVIVTAIPPLALFLAIHLLVIMVSPTEDQKAELARVRKRKERLRAIEEKELERIEKESLVKGIRSAVNPPMVTVLTEEKLSPPPVLEPALPVTASVVEPVASHTEPKGYLTETEVERKLHELLQNGESLPTGRMIAEWLGKSERTGQNLLRKFKVASNIE